MIYLKVNNRSTNSFSFTWLQEGKLYKIKELLVTGDELTLGTYYGTPKFYFDEISAVEALIECKKRGIKIEDIQEIK